MYDRMWPLNDWDRVYAMPLGERVPIFQKYLEENPQDANIWFDLGLAFKQMRDWRSCADANLRALEITSEPEDPAWWNLGIAATALRDWTLARKAWRGYGIEISGEEGPVECNFGSTPVRLIETEVVWGVRLDPARVAIRNIPLRAPEFRWGDIVLHDGAPSGEREVNGRSYPVFDVLERWSPSEIPTLTVDVRCNSQSSEALVDIFDSRGFAAEDWTANVRNLCKACSEGLPSGHSHPFSPGSDDREFGLASPMGLARQLLEEWRSALPDERSYEGLRFFTADSPP